MSNGDGSWVNCYPKQNKHKSSSMLRPLNPNFINNINSPLLDLQGQWREKMKEWIKTDVKYTDESSPSYSPSFWILRLFPIQPFFRNWWIQAYRIGGAEQIALYLQQLELDSDGDGLISEQELEQGLQKSQQIVDDALRLLETCGIIGALLMTLLYPQFFVDLEYNTDSIDYFGRHTCVIIKYCCFALICVSFTLACNAVILSLALFRHISFYLPSLKSKLWYLQKVSLGPVVASTVLCLFTTVLGIPFGKHAK